MTDSWKAARKSELKEAVKNLGGLSRARREALLKELERRKLGHLVSDLKGAAAIGGPNEALQAIGRRDEMGDASWTHLIFFAGFALLVGGSFALPFSLAAVFETVETETGRLFLAEPPAAIFLRCWLMVGIALIGFGMELRFSWPRYVLASALFALWSTPSAFRGGGGFLLVGSGVLGLLYVWLFGRWGVISANFVARKGGVLGIRFANGAILVLLVAVGWALVSNVNPRASGPSETAPATESAVR